MWYYVKTLEYPINFKCKDLKYGKISNITIWRS